MNLVSLKKRSTIDRLFMKLPKFSLYTLILGYLLSASTLSMAQSLSAQSLGSGLNLNYPGQAFTYFNWQYPLDDCFHTTSGRLISKGSGLRLELIPPINPNPSEDVGDLVGWLNLLGVSPAHAIMSLNRIGSTDIASATEPSWEQLFPFLNWFTEDSIVFGIRLAWDEGTYIPKSFEFNQAALTSNELKDPNTVRQKCGFFVTQKVRRQAYTAWIFRVQTRDRSARSKLLRQMDFINSARWSWPYSQDPFQGPIGCSFCNHGRKLEFPDKDFWETILSTGGAQVVKITTENQNEPPFSASEFEVRTESEINNILNQFKTEITSLTDKKLRLEKRTITTHVQVGSVDEYIPASVKQMNVEAWGDPHQFNYNLGATVEQVEAAFAATLYSQTMADDIALFLSGQKPGLEHWLQILSQDRLTILQEAETYLRQYIDEINGQLYPAHEINRVDGVPYFWFVDSGLMLPTEFLKLDEQTSGWGYWVLPTNDAIRNAMIWFGYCGRIQEVEESLLPPEISSSFPYLNLQNISLASDIDPEFLTLHSGVYGFIVPEDNGTGSTNSLIQYYGGVDSPPEWLWQGEAGITLGDNGPRSDVLLLIQLGASLPVTTPLAVTHGEQVAIAQPFIIQATPAPTSGTEDLSTEYTGQVEDDSQNKVVETRLFIVALKCVNFYNLINELTVVNLTDGIELPLHLRFLLPFESAKQEMFYANLDNPLQFRGWNKLPDWFLKALDQQKFLDLLYEEYGLFNESNPAVFFPKGLIDSPTPLSPFGGLPGDNLWNKPPNFEDWMSFDPSTMPPGGIPPEGWLPGFNPNIIPPIHPTP